MEQAAKLDVSNCVITFREPRTARELARTLQSFVLSAFDVGSPGSFDD